MKDLPASLLQDLQGVKDFDTPAFIAAHQQPAPVSVRLHPLKGGSLFQGNEKVKWCTEGRYLSERPVFTTDPLFHAGAYYVQEASSMFLDHLLRSLIAGRTGLRVLDLCAAPGGKSTLIASLLDKESLLVSNEVIRSRASVLEENMTRWGYMNTWVTSNDPRDFSGLSGYFDVIVVDAPCSGSGLFRKDERALDEWTEANVQLCGQRQQRILADVWPALKEDGILIYATCSYSPREDEEILDWLAAEFNLDSLNVAVPPDWGIITVSSAQKNMTGYRFSPDRLRGEGFFIAALQKKEVAAVPKQGKFRSANDKNVQQQAQHFIADSEIVCLQTGKDNFGAIAAAHEADLQLLQRSLYLRKAGLAIGMPAHKEWIPAHDIALSIDAPEGLEQVAVNKEQALHFLKKEDMSLPAMAKGWYLVRYEGLGLGWIKSLGNRFNNYLPKHWRIRMEISDADWA